MKYYKEKKNSSFGFESYRMLRTGTKNKDIILPENDTKCNFSALSFVKAVSVLLGAVVVFFLKRKRK